MTETQSKEIEREFIKLNLSSELKEIINDLVKMRIEAEHLFDKESTIDNGILAAYEASAQLKWIEKKMVNFNKKMKKIENGI